MIRLFAYIILLCAGTTLQAALHHVGPDHPLREISEAVCLANPGDSIFIEGGFYREGNIVIDKPLSLIGRNNPVLDGNFETEILTIIADKVSIEGLMIQNVGTSYLEDRAAIRVRKAKDFLIRNNTLLNSFFGIYLEHSRRGMVIQNTIIGEAQEEMSSGNGIHLWYSKNIRVVNNLITHHRDGIYLEFVNESFIGENISEENLRYGLHFMFSDDNEYAENIFRKNGAGVAVMFSRRIIMSRNVFEHNWGASSYGLLLKEIYDAEIRENVFRQNTTGIYVEGSTRVNYLSNELEGNGWAMKISGGCLDNIIRGNNFFSNTFDLAVHSKMEQNNFNGNFWSGYNGYDLDKDEVGDIPFRPVKLFSYVVNKTPESVILLRSLFVDILNFSEKVSPAFTPKEVQDDSPAMKPFRLHFQPITTNQ